MTHEGATLSSGVATQGGVGRSGLVSYTRQKQIFKVSIIAFMVIYSLITLFPFYVLFVRTFVSSKEAGTLHLWIPKEEDVTLDAGIGNLGVQYNLDITKVKKDLGIKGYINPQSTLREIAEQFNIPPEKIQDYFRGYGTYNGWINLLLRGPAYWYALLRTLVITFFGLVGLNVLGIMTGYGLRGLRRGDQMFIYNLYILQMVIPAMLIIIPQFLIVQSLQKLIPGTDQPGPARYIVQIISVILLNVKGGALSTLIFTNAISAIPREIEEAAQIDGASRLQYLFHILLPLLKAPIATVIVIMLPAIWNQFLEGFVYLDPANTTVLVMVREIGGQYAVNYQMVYTGVFVSILPLLLVYMVFRRFFIEGAMAGAIKG
jgi:ABC-type glycerol-3-phosphate transport system permease component